MLTSFKTVINQSLKFLNPKISKVLANIRISKLEIMYSLVKRLNLTWKLHQAKIVKQRQIERLLSNNVKRVQEEHQWVVLKKISQLKILLLGILKGVSSIKLSRSRNLEVVSTVYKSSSRNTKFWKIENLKSSQVHIKNSMMIELQEKMMRVSR